MSGCVREEKDAQALTFTYELWVPLSALLGGLVATPIGWFLRKKSTRFGWGLLIAGPAAVLLLAPSLFLSQVTVGENEFSMKDGFWGMTAVHNVQYDDLKVIRIISEESTGRRGRKSMKYYLMCERKDGTSAKVPVNNDLTEAAGPHFLQRVVDRDIPIIDET